MAGHGSIWSRYGLLRTARSTYLMARLAKIATRRYRRDGRLVWLGAAAAFAGVRVVRAVLMSGPASERLQIRPGEAFEIRVVPRGRR